MDEKLRKSLNEIEAPMPRKRARTDAFAAAMAAFEAEQEEGKSTETHGASQGNAPRGRLRSIVSMMKRKWTMDIRLTAGATLAALIALPLGLYFINQTALTPFDPGLPATVDEKAVGEGAGLPQADREPPVETIRERPQSEAAQTAAAPQADRAPAPVPPQTMPAMTQQAFESAGVRMQPTGVAPEAQSGDRFAQFEEGGIRRVSDAPVSTFSIDVDTTSYAYVRRLLEMGQIPPAEAIRIEELINYFDYDYPAPEAGGEPFLPSISVTPTPWNPESRLVQIGIKGEDIDIDAVPPANLVLLIDTSGSMNSPDKLPLLKRAFSLLVDELGAEDTISIVAYAGSAGVVLEPTSGSEKAKILEAIETLSPGGSTAGAQGIEAAYALAEQAMVDGGTNRVLLATDGDFNVGVSDPADLERMIEARREAGVFLSVLGFGTGNYNDAAMQSLSQTGNGTAAYIDSFTEARKVLVEELGGTLMTIAKDVKVQAEFNPATVSEYRLIGYETRALDREDFNNDAVDAGDIGAGHTATAIYEITPVGAQGSVDPLRYGEQEMDSAGDADEYGFLKLRYKAPDGDDSQLIEMPIPVGEVETLAQAPEDVRFATAVAAFGQKLKGSDHLRAMGWDDILDLARSGRGDDPSGRRAEFIGLIDLAASLE